MNSISMFDNAKEALSDFLENIHSGTIQLPDLQRSFVWSDQQVMKLISSISQSFPIGSFLTLKTNETGAIAIFKPRLLEGVELNNPPNPESMILDGQQRATTSYMCFRSGRPVLIRDKRTQKIQERVYYINIRAALDPNIDRIDAIISFPVTRIKKGRYGYANCSTPEREYELMMFPVSEVFNFPAWRGEFQKHWKYEADKLKLIEQFETEIIKKFEHYQIAVIELRPELSKIAVCQVFEDVNEMPTPLTFFDLTTALFAASDFSLRNHFEDVTRELYKFNVLQEIRNTDWLAGVTLLATYHRRQNVIQSGANVHQLPGVGCRTRVYNLSLEEYKTHSYQMLAGFKETAKFLHGLGFQQPSDIAYPMQLVTLAAIISVVGLLNDNSRSKLERWWWSGLFGEKYIAWQSHLTAKDMLEAPEWISSGKVPSLIESTSFDGKRLLTVTRRQGAVFKALNALLRKHGAIDFSTGEELSNVKAFDDAIESHHVFPEAWCKKQNIEAHLYNCLINRTPLRDRTNRFIGGKAPSEYLLKLVQQQGISKKRLDKILTSHLIEPETLWMDDFETFFVLRRRALLDLIAKAMGKSVVLDTTEATSKESKTKNMQNRVQQIQLI
ncbi:hypothetical protein NIES2101_09345 [Calothrix sp. HK-06]|nr:hypothetical protein NIES2101_09345 [Calothrix sp. HK-06]